VETQIDRSFFAFTQYYLYYFDGHWSFGYLCWVEEAQLRHHF
jgi:hypothetical protein